MLIRLELSGPGSSTTCEILGFTDRFSEALASAHFVISLIFMV